MAPLTAGPSSTPTGSGSDRNRQARDRLLPDYLLAQGLDRIYTSESLGRCWTLLFHERIVFSDPYQENYLGYSLAVDGSPRAAYLLEAGAPVFENNLRAAGGSFKRSQAPGGLLLYSHFQPPPEGRALSRAGWQGSGNPESPATDLAFDGDILSGWSAPQQAGSFFQLDLGCRQQVSGLSWIPGNYREVPAGYELLISDDQRSWKTVVRVEKYLGPFFWSGSKPMIKIRGGKIEANFPPVSGRYLLVRLLGEDRARRWSINELLVYSPAREETTAVAGRWAYWPELIRFLEGSGLDRVAAGPELSAALRVHSKKFRTVPFQSFPGGLWAAHPPANRVYRPDAGANSRLGLGRAEG